MTEYYEENYGNVHTKSHFGKQYQESKKREEFAEIIQTVRDEQNCKNKLEKRKAIAQ